MQLWVSLPRRPQLRNDQCTTHFRSAIEYVSALHPRNVAPLTKFSQRLADDYHLRRLCDVVVSYVVLVFYSSSCRVHCGLTWSIRRLVLTPRPCRDVAVGYFIAVDAIVSSSRPCVHVQQSSLERVPRAHLRTPAHFVSITNAADPVFCSSC